MGKFDHLVAYAVGWITGDTDKILSVLVDDYELDDPFHGRVTKREMVAYIDGMKRKIGQLRDGKQESPFLSLSDVLTGEEDGELIAWSWWMIPGTSIQGASLVKVSDDGIVSERLTYYTAPLD